MQAPVSVRVLLLPQNAQRLAGCLARWAPNLLLEEVMMEKVRGGGRKAEREATGGPGVQGG